MWCHSIPFQPTMTMCAFAQHMARTLGNNTERNEEPRVNVLQAAVLAAQRHYATRNKL